MADPLSRTAPFYTIPSRQILSIEHPAIIKNVDKAIDTLQGSAGIIKALNPPKADTPVHLLLRPEDAMSRPAQSISTQSNNILLKVTVPKRTGRKRKRGSDGPFVEDPACVIPGNAPPRPTARDVLRTLRDNEGKYQVEPVGLIERTHVFRGMPDFVFSTTRSPFINRVRDTILPFDYRKMKEFDLDMSKGAISNVDLIPPPSFSHGDLPFNYFYRQNPTVRQTLDTSGNITTVNTQQAAKILTHLVPYDIETVPSAPRPNCPPFETLDPTLRETINVINSLFATRPAWSRRALRNQLTTIEQRYALRHAIPHVGYVFRSGPWRDAIIRFGHDPRTDPASRIYQTTMFRILPREAETARDGAGGRRHTLPRANELTPEAASTTTSHLFTGIPPLPLDGRMWMFCDITDPVLARILKPSDPLPEGFVREKCDIMVDGWYGNGTTAKLKAIMRHKIITLYEGRTPNDDDYTRILALPDWASPEAGMADFWLDPSQASAKEMSLATEIRSTIKGAATWKEVSGGKRSIVKKDGEGEKGGNQAGAAEGEGEEEEESGVEDESEGEEEAIEQQEIMEAAVEAVDRAVERREAEGEDESDDHMSDQ
ncbi:RNA polymerase III transcription factor IIIC subunit-domain-containing protein [Aspergillus pseudodeflectus]|uniref:RNA polymerase III transcription factor IIIC subunit-domain-containing protein n=1 Tax=Aspergillus pseudodeflectus TaxID=176178 RepID=A0ABR4JMT3_9EURO